jgi:hypothetical protein
MGPLRLSTLVIVFSLVALTAAYGQDNYEIQVYGSEMGPPGSTMMELHSNFTVLGSTKVKDGVNPTQHSMHETLEVTHGFTDWFEIGFYVFSSIQPDGGWQWVGDHIRPRLTVPESWHWPVGLSLAQEFGYQQRSFSEDTWTWELRPIIDKKAGRWYASFNPTFDRSLHGDGVKRGFEFSPNAKVSFDFTKKIAGGLEYYGALGSVTGFSPWSHQHHQFFPTIDLDVSPKWELNFGLGYDASSPNDRLIVKFILGRRFSWGGDRDRDEPANNATCESKKKSRY